MASTKMFISALKPLHKTDPPPPRLLRQALLHPYFDSTPRSSNPPDLHDGYDPLPSPGSTLPDPPTEIWLTILPHLGTLALKNVRLVSRAFADLVPPFLYSTVYVNSCEDSWAGLITISQSPYAHLVQNIVWSPLVLHPEALDADRWASFYPNLLRGLSSREISNYFKAYRRVHQNTLCSFRPSSLELASTALSNMRKCCRISISDEYDTEKGCADRDFRRSFQRDRHRHLNMASVWGLRPRMCDPCEIKQAASFLQAVFCVLEKCHLSFRLDIDLWMTYWNAARNTELWSCRNCIVWNELVLPHQISKFPNITVFRLKLKYCKIPHTDYLKRDLEAALHDTFECFARFPDLEELAFQLSYVDPGKKMLDTMAERAGVCDCVSSQDSCDGIASLSCTKGKYLDKAGWHDQPLCRSSLDLIDNHAEFHGMTGEILRCMYAEISLPGELAKLKTIALSNGCLDARLLLQWLCELPQLPSSQMAVFLTGTVVFYGIEPLLLFHLLASLNVTLSYDSAHTFYYAPEETAALTPTLLPEIDLYIGWRRTPVSRIRRHAHDWDATRWRRNPLHMPQPSALDTVDISHATKILHRTNDNKVLRARYDVDMLQSHFTYRIRYGKEGCIWEFVNGSADPQDNLAVRLNETEHTYNLFSVTLWVPANADE